MFQRCLVGRLGYDFQTANAGCMWCAGPSWLLGISFTPKIGMEAVWNSSSQRNLPTFQNFTASCPIPRLRILGKPFLCFFWRSAFIESCGETDPLTTFGMNRHNCTAGGAGPNEPWRFHCIRSCSLLLLPLASVLILLGSTSEQTLPQAVYYLLLVMTTATWRQERDSYVRRSPHCSICDGVIAMVGFKKIKLSPSKPFRPWNEMILHDITFHWSLILKG